MFHASAWKRLQSEEYDDVRARKTSAACAVGHPPPLACHSQPASLQFIPCSSFVIKKARFIRSVVLEFNCFADGISSAGITNHLLRLKENFHGTLRRISGITFVILPGWRYALRRTSKPLETSTTKIRVPVEWRCKYTNAKRLVSTGNIHELSLCAVFFSVSLHFILSVTYN